MPGAPSWWHDDMWRLGRDVGGMAGWASSDRDDDRQGPLRWRLYRAARELRSYGPYTLTVGFCSS